jgi:hypothetical protein
MYDDAPFVGRPRLDHLMRCANEPESCGWVRGTSSLVSGRFRPRACVSSPDAPPALDGQRGLGAGT